MKTWLHWRGLTAASDMGSDIAPDITIARTHHGANECVVTGVGVLDLSRESEHCIDHG
jgi:hypothetical protein